MEYTEDWLKEKVYVGERLGSSLHGFVFTVDEIRNDGWVWGEDMPIPYIGVNLEKKNFHDSRFLEKVKIKI